MIVIFFTAFTIVILLISSLIADNKKIAFRIYTIFSKTILLPLAIEHSDGNYRSFKLPSVVWEDQYVIAFVSIFINCLLDFGFNGKLMSPEKRGTILMYSLKLLCGEQAKNICNKLKYPRSKELREDEEFSRGAKDAIVSFYVITNQPNTDDSHPTIKMALKLAKSIHSNALEIDTIRNPNFYSSLGVAILMQTIQKHINEKYFSNIIKLGSLSN